MQKWKIALQYECSPVNLLHILITPLSKNTSAGLVLLFVKIVELMKYTNEQFSGKDKIGKGCCVNVVLSNSKVYL